jgi:hypothetical protein
MQHFAAPVIGLLSAIDDRRPLLCIHANCAASGWKGIGGT